MSQEILVSNGEIIDKLTILELKSKFISDNAKLTNINKELKYIQQISKPLITDQYIYKLYLELQNINEKLWIIEDSIRKQEQQKIFDDTFISLARKVYLTNDLRSQIKKNINIYTQSSFIEEKLYTDYQRVNN